MKNKEFSLENMSILRKVFTAFFLISILPLMIAGFYFTYKFLPSYVVVTLGINVLLGWMIVFQVFLSISKVARKACRSTGVEIQSLKSKDEVKVLDKAFDEISVKAKQSFEELKEISQNTEQLNLKVSRKASLLSTVMQINDLIAKGREGKDFFTLLSGRIKEILGVDLSFILLDRGGRAFIKEASESKEEIIYQPLNKDSGFLKPLIKSRRALILDVNHQDSQELRDLAVNVLRVNSLVLSPILIENKVLGILGIGKENPADFSRKEFLNDLDILTKYAGLLLEHSRLKAKVSDLDIRDALSGLYNEKFIRDKLDEEVKKSVQEHTPCGFILLRVEGVKEYIDKSGVLSFEKALKNISRILSGNLSFSQKAGRLAEDKFGIIVLGESKVKLKEFTLRIVSEIKESLERQKIPLSLLSSEAENPIDGVTARELINKAENSLR